MNRATNIIRAARSRHTTHIAIRREGERLRNEPLLGTAMRLAYDHFEQLTTQLDEVERTVRSTFAVPGLGRLDNLPQREYRVRRSADRSKVTFSFIYRIPSIDAVPVPGDVATGAGSSEAEVGVLRYRSTPSSSPGVPFDIDCYIPVSIELEVDADEGLIRLTTTNLGGPDRETHRFAPEALTLDVLRSLSNRIKQRRNQFASYTEHQLSNELRAHLRTQVQARLEVKQEQTETRGQRAMRWLRGRLGNSAANDAAPRTARAAA